MRQLFLWFSVSAMLWAQYPLLTISDIQTPKAPPANDTSIYYGDTVRVRGVVVTPPDQWWNAPNNYSFWIQDSGNSGPKTGLHIFLGDGTKANALGVSSLQPGMYVELLGVVDYYRGETELVLDTNTAVLVLATNIPIQGPDTVSVGTFNDMNNQAQPTGEQWQGSYVAIKDVDVINVSGNPNRGFFTVVDAAGNQITIWDNFKAMSPANGFLKPQVGDKFISIAGILFHYRSGTTDLYELCPWDTSQFVRGPSSPVIQTMSRDIACPKSTDSVTISADVIHPSTTVTIDSVILFYGLSPTDTQWKKIMMTQVGGLWVGKIPPQPHGTFVHYWVKAYDSTGRSSYFPAYQPRCYTVNDNGCFISDIQKTSEVTFLPTEWFTSGYEGLTVVDVVGVVTATRSDLGYVYIQEPGKTAWAGIQLTGDPSIDLFQLGDSVKVTGVVEEYYGLTQLRVTQSTKLGTTTPIEPISLPISLFNPTDDQVYATEAYESMLIRIADPPLYVVDPKPYNFYGGQGAYRIGKDTLDPNAGLLVLAGRATNNVFSSLNVSYINDSMWIFIDGVIDTTQIPVCVVSDSTVMDSIQGILTYAWGQVKLLPRNNSDFFNVRGTPCGKLQSRVTESLKAVLRIYPNPTSGRLIIEHSSGGELYGILYDLMGKCIDKQRWIGKKVEYYLPKELREGVYLLKIIDDGGRTTFYRILLGKF